MYWQKGLRLIIEKQSNNHFSTSHHWAPLLEWDELTPRQRKKVKIDYCVYLDSSFVSVDEVRYFTYRGKVFIFESFSEVDSRSPACTNGFDAYLEISEFVTMLVKEEFVEGSDHVRVTHHYCSTTQ